MIQPQGTGTLPDTDTTDQPAHRYGEFAYEVLVTGRNAHLRRVPEAETEVTS